MQWPFNYFTNNLYKQPEFVRKLLTTNYFYFQIKLPSLSLKSVMLRAILLIFLCSSTLFAQTSTIRGAVKDADTGLPLASATVQLLPTSQGTTANDAGDFRFEQLPVGRYILSVSFVGYETVTIPEILLESGKEIVQDVKLTPAGKQLLEAIVTTARPVAFNSVQSITIEQTLRYAATYLDPARVATSFAGVAAAHDQANGLVVRGNSPNGMQWRLEGVEIVNPNHLSNAGTFSDRSTQTGGGVNILSTQLLGNSNFLSGAFPAQYGNAISGIMDMHLRKGNDEKAEFVAQAGLIGLDVAAEGPFSKKSKASYLANYRYSFTGLLGAMGVDFGGEVNRFQDLSFNINLPTAKGGTFTIFGIGGVSGNTFTAERDSSLWEYQKDGRDIIFKNKMGAAGLTHHYLIGKRTSWNTTIVASGFTLSRESFDIGGIDYSSRVLTESDEQTKARGAVSSNVTHRFSDRSRGRVGVYATRGIDEILSNQYPGARKLESLMLEPFVDWTYQLAPSLTTELGVHSVFSTQTLHERKGKNVSLEPRAALRWRVDRSQQLSFSYGLHSQSHAAQVYLADYPTYDFTGNINLRPTRAHHFVIGYEKTLQKNSSLKIEAYLQNLYDVPVTFGSASSFSTINLIETYVNQKLVNDGTGRNYGVEATYQKLLIDQFYMLVSGSVYSATYVGSDGVRRDSRFNGGHTFAFTGGKEFKTRKASIWGVNLKVLLTGGFRDTPINIDQSTRANATIYDERQAFSVKMKEYFRPDLRIYWKKSKARYSRTLALDLQNVSGTKNDAYDYFDTFRKAVVRQHQLGMIPVLSYRWEF
jgi:hypothetical protein